MSEFICKKPITLSGQSFSYGDVIPDGFVLPGRELSLIRSNYIAEIGSGAMITDTVPDGSLEWQTGEASPPNPIIIPITVNEGILELATSPQTIINVLTIMQKTVEDATEDINVLTDRDALLLLNAVDSRAGIKKAAEKRNSQLGAAEDETPKETPEDEVQTPGTDAEPESDGEKGEGAGDA